MNRFTFNRIDLPKIPEQTTEPALSVDLGSTKLLKIVPERRVTSNKIEISHIVDIYLQKKVIAYTNSVLGPIVLWEGDAYDTIGQWTDQDVTNRILEIVNAINP